MSKIEIKLLGQKIALKAPGTDPDHAREVVGLVAERLAHAEKRSKAGTASHQVALLALLDLADEYIQARERTREFKRDIQEKSGKLAGLIESELK
jgi:cell division protein ZapA (FtsZ GTPase activity inhibitor)